MSPWLCAAAVPVGPWAAEPSELVLARAIQRATRAQVVDSARAAATALAAASGRHQFQQLQRGRSVPMPSLLTRRPQGPSNQLLAAEEANQMKAV